jgi:addiction module HigA family antidote
MKKLKNVHPGEVLKEEFMTPLKVPVLKLSVATFIPEQAIDELLKEQRRVDADIALKLGKYFGTTAKFWLGLQDDYDLEEEMARSSNVLKSIKSIQEDAV